MSPETDLRRARAVADAVMYEGYLLYPYRASAAKNLIRLAVRSARPSRRSCWDEAIEHEVVVATIRMDGNELDTRFPCRVEGAADEATELRDHAGRPAVRLVRTRRPLAHWSTCGRRP